MSRILTLALILPFLFLACKTKTPAVPETPPVEEPAVVVVVEEPVVQEEPRAYDVSQEMYDRTLAEVKSFIDNLNVAIRDKNFKEWSSALTSERLKEVSSAKFLREQSEAPSLKTRNIILKTANDYFLQVVVPSRANSKVDELDFIDESNVKAFFLETRNQKNENNEMVPVTRRLLLYELTKSGSDWKIKR